MRSTAIMCIQLRICICIVAVSTYMYMHSRSVYSKNKAMSTASTVAYCTYYLHIVHTIYRIAWTLN